MTLPVFFAGLSMGLSLIVAIGAQNAFVLRQGLKGEHVFTVCLACAVSDAILITLGVAGFGKLIAWLPWLGPVMRYGGAAFLIWYGGKSLWSALRSTGALATVEAPPAPMGKTVLACLAITWLNPHVYLDTLVLLGSISTQFPSGQVAFGLGAMTASFLFFFALGYGAGWLRPLFAKPQAWRVLEFAIAVVMGSIAVKLLIGQ